MTTEHPLQNGRRERRKVRVRRGLMDAALALFGEHGLWTTRIEDITERADVAKGVFYNHFPSKDDLVAELLDEVFGAIEDAWPPLDVGADPMERIRELARAHLAYLQAHPEHLLLLHQARGLLKIRGGDGGRLQQVFRSYLLVLGRSALGVPREDPTVEEAIGMGAVIAGTISGCVSYRLAIGLEGPVSSLEDVVVGATSAWLGTLPHAQGTGDGRAPSGGAAGST